MIISDVPSDIQSGILIVGSLGYSTDREFWTTPVYRLDLNGMWIQPFETSRDMPRWINHRRAILLPGGKLLVTEGRVFSDAETIDPNLETFELDLWDRTWRRIG